MALPDAVLSGSFAVDMSRNLEAYLASDWYVEILTCLLLGPKRIKEVRRKLMRRRSVYFRFAKG